MRFKHRIHNQVYVVPSKKHVVEPFGKGYRRVPEVTYRAEFSEFEWDSLQGQQTYGWSDEERVFVEDYLKGHRDFGVSGSIVTGVGGLYLMDEAGELQPEDLHVESGDVKLGTGRRRCQYTHEMPGGKVEQCGRLIKNDSETGLCKTHEKVLEGLKG